MISTEKRRAVDAILEPALREVEKKLLAAGFCVEAGMLLTVVVPKDEGEFSVIEWRLFQEGMPDMLDAMVRQALDLSPTSRVDAAMRGVSWRPAPRELVLGPALIPREPEVCALAQTQPAKSRHPILQWFCAWLRPSPRS